MATILPILRSLLAFFHAAALIKKDLSGIVMGCFVQRGSVAAYISKEDQAKLVAQLAKESKRTKAVILLAMHLGLRDCDICNLSFQEIDWRNDKIRLIQKKTGEPLVLPLLPDVGNALPDYILDERPKRADHYPYIFLRKQAPYNKLTAGYLFYKLILDCWFHESWDKLPESGAITGNPARVHDFRHGYAVHRLNQWVKEGHDLNALYPYLSEYMGHCNYADTDYYLFLVEEFYPEMEQRLSSVNDDILPKVHHEEE